MTRLADPDPVTPERSTEQVWWPPVMLQPDWVRDHDFDVFHIQFGFDAWDPAELDRLVQMLRERGRPLVYRVPTCTTRITRPLPARCPAGCPRPAR